MAVLATSLWRVRLSETQDFLADAASAKKIPERLGGPGHLVNKVVGTWWASSRCASKVCSVPKARMRGSRKRC